MSNFDFEQTRKQIEDLNGKSKVVLQQVRELENQHKEIAKEHTLKVQEYDHINDQIDQLTDLYNMKARETQKRKGNKLCQSR